MAQENDTTFSEENIDLVYSEDYDVSEVRYTDDEITSANNSECNSDNSYLGIDRADDGPSNLTTDGSPPSQARFRTIHVAENVFNNQETRNLRTGDEAKKKTERRQSVCFRSPEGTVPNLERDFLLRTDNTEINQEIIDEGLRLYLMFLRDEIVSNRLRTPACINVETNGSFPRNITALRTLASQFSASPQRERVRLQAQAVELETLDLHSFLDLLIGLFQEGGVTWERVVVLFFFCADLSVRALKEHLMRTFHCITNWTTYFITDNFCRWVAQNGGWGVVLQQSINQATKLAFMGVCCVTILALCVFIKNNS